MKKLLLLGAAIVFMAASCNQTTTQNASVNYPEPTGYVVDAAGVLGSNRDGLETILSDFEKTTGNEVAIVTVKSLDGLDIESYSIHLAELWKVGKKTSDNGVIFLVSTGDRKARIEVGRGVEDKISDAKAGQILDQAVIPAFKKNDWVLGIAQGTKAITDALK